MTAQGYRQYTITDGSRTFADLPAPCAVDALARFAMREYTDPRVLAAQDPDMDPFFLHEGAVWMVYENLQLTAV